MEITSITSITLFAIIASLFVIFLLEAILNVDTFAGRFFKKITKNRPKHDTRDD